MHYELSATFARSDATRDFQEIWKRMCYDFLVAVFPSSSVLRMDSNVYGVDVLDQTTKMAYSCHAIDEPSSDTLPIDGVIASLERAVRHREQLGWKRYNIATNTDFSDEALGFLRDRARALHVSAEEVGLLGPATWDRLCSEYPSVVESWFDYRVVVPKDAVSKTFEEARYYPEYVSKYTNQIAEADYNVVLTNNRTPVALVLPFAPQLTVKHLLEVGKVFLDLSLDETEFRDLGTSARLSLSVWVDEIQQTFNTPLADVPIASGGKAQIWIKIIWKEESFDRSPPDDGLPRRKASPFYERHLAMNFCLLDSFKTMRSTDVAKGYTLSVIPSVPGLLEKTSQKEQTLARKAALVSAGIWQKAKGLLPSLRTYSKPSSQGQRIPVRLGASAPRAVSVNSSFVARFVAYHPDLETELTKQLNQWASEATHRLDCTRANWKLGTPVKVRAYGDNLEVNPEEDEFRWGGEKHILDFRVNVSEEAKGSCDLKFDVYVEGHRISRIWMPLEVSNDPTDELQSKFASSPLTAFASYASEDRLRVLDRVATLEIHCGIRVFLDCVSMRPNTKWRELLPHMVLESDQLLLFWSKAARDSKWVEEEWRIAFSQKGIDGIEIHPLSTYTEAKLPAELADLVHGADPLMVIRANEERARP